MRDVNGLARNPWPQGPLNWILGAITLLAAFALCVSLAFAKDRYSASTVEIVRADGGIGSAVQIGPKFFVTAAHVVRDDKQVLVKDDANVREYGQVIASFPDIDIAFVTLADGYLNVTVSEIECVAPPVGTPVWLVGNPLGTRSVVLPGHIVIARTVLSDWPFLFIVDRPGIPGMSGGPALTEDGAVIGIIVARTDFGGLAGVVPSVLVCEKLHSLEFGGKEIAPNARFPP